MCILKTLSLIKEKLKQTRLAPVYRIVRGYILSAYEKTLSDEHYLNKKYQKAFGKKISRDNPQTFNEKLNWLKLYWYDPKAEICSDKYAVRAYLESIGLGHLLNELIAVYDSVDKIDFDSLPSKFVLKCTHGSACNIICEDKDKLDRSKTKKKLNKWMKLNYYWFSREWVYKNLKPRIICEKFLKDDVLRELIDYKFFCFNGVPEYVMLVTERFSDTGLKLDFYDTQWNHLEFRRDHPMSGRKLIQPANYDIMLEYAKVLSSEFPFVRVDFFEVNGKVYFGELTFFPGGGFEQFQPVEYDYKFGEKLILPK